MENGTKPLIVIKELAGNPEPHLNTIQKLLAPHVEFLTLLWTAVWVVTVLVLFATLWHEYTHRHRNGSR